LDPVLYDGSTGLSKLLKKIVKIRFDYFLRPV